MNPRTSAGLAENSGKISRNEAFFIDASAFGTFSHLSVKLHGKNSESIPESGTISVHRSQKAFFYPEGDPAPFPEGSLLKNDGTYFIITPSETKELFGTEQEVRMIGYNPEIFIPVSKEEISLYPDQKKDASAINGYSPNGTFFQIDENFYEFKEKKFFQFVSREAFLYRYPESWALKRDSSFLTMAQEEENISDTWIGYPSGSLLSWGEGVFLMDNNTARPILGIDIFLSLGYSWNDVRPANDEEISFSQKGKFIYFNAPHPDGSVLFDTKEKKYFLISKEKKREIQGESKLRLWLGDRNPISVSSESLTKRSSCSIQKKFSYFSGHFAICSVPLDILENFSGNSYEISFNAPTETNMDRMDVSFKTSVNQETFLKTLSKLAQRALSRFIPIP